MGRREGCLPARTLPGGLGWHGALLPAAWQGVERDLRSQMSGSERGLVEEYVEKVPNPSLKSEWAGRPGGARFLFPAGEAAGQGGRDRASGGGGRLRTGSCPSCALRRLSCSPAAFKPVDLSDLKRRNTQDAKKS